MDTSEKFTVVEFCAGYGGIHLGLKRAIRNMCLIAACEIEAFAIANLVAKMESGLMDAAPVWPNLKTFPNSEFHGLVDLLVAGFPCQPFSQAGKRDTSDDPRHLFPYIKQSLIDMQPGAVFLENVEGILSAKLKGDHWADPEGTSVLLHVLRELERVGYRATAGVFSAVECGAPHQRKRVFIYGELADMYGKRSQRGEWQRQTGEERTPCRYDSECFTSTLYPAKPGEEQFNWEPPRDLANPSQPPMGRDFDGFANRMVYAELYESCDNQIDELRLLGNGVVPDTAERAYRTLYARLHEVCQ